MSRVSLDGNRRGMGASLCVLPAGQAEDRRPDRVREAGRQSRGYTLLRQEQLRDGIGFFVLIYCDKNSLVMALSIFFLLTATRTASRRQASRHCACTDVRARSQLLTSVSRGCELAVVWPTLHTASPGTSLYAGGTRGEGAHTVRRATARRCVARVHAGLPKVRL